MILNCHVPSVQGVGTRSLIYKLNVKTGKQLQRYNRPHSETFTCEVCSYVYIYSESASEDQILKFIYFELEVFVISCLV